MEHGAFRLFYDEKLPLAEQLKRVPEYIPPFDHTEEVPTDYSINVAASISHFSEEMKNSKSLVV